MVDAKTYCHLQPAKTTSALTMVTKVRILAASAYSPAPVVTDEIHQRIMNEAINPTVEGMQKKATHTLVSICRFNDHR